MKNIKIVIGAGFGDEGKGIMTARLAKDWADLNVRYSSGCGATHTVKSKDGFSHVFGHIGSAYSVGVPTYLDSEFIVCPTLFSMEDAELLSKNKGGRVYVNPRCKVTTIYDVMLNQFTELSRGDKRHGSTGVGTYETIKRNSVNYPEFRLNVMDMVSGDAYRLVKYIRDMYILPEVARRGIHGLPEEVEHMLHSDETIEKTVESFNTFISMITPCFIDDVRGWDNVIFEGSQGLLLDQNNTAYMPYCTPSNTGLTNALKLIHSTRIYEGNPYIDDEDPGIEVHYVTRPYYTRHGPGPLPNEQDISSMFNVVDDTNIPNTFQGTIRYGLMDYTLLNATIKKDLKLLNGIKHNVILDVTCMDQCSGTWLENEIKQNFSNKVEISDIRYHYSPYVEDD